MGYMLILQNRTLTDHDTNHAHGQLHRRETRQSDNKKKQKDINFGDY